MFNQLFLIALIIFFAANMGASGIAPSFAALYGAKLIKRKKAVIFFTIFVILGAVTFGHGVSATLGKSLLPKGLLNPNSVLIILLSAALSLFVANIFKVPQSTSQVTVASVVGAGLYFKQLYWKVLLFKILPAWFILPALSYFLTIFLYKHIYPPRHRNLHIYEKVLVHEKKLKITALVVSCYVAFAIGSNNVANAVGPLYGAGLIGVFIGLVSIAPLFGLGAYLMGKGSLDTAGKKIIPLGLISSTLVSFVTATLLFVASCFGIPQSLVQLNVFSLFAVSCLKDGHKETMLRDVTKKTFFIWAITPLFSVAATYFLLLLGGHYGFIK